MSSPFHVEVEGLDELVKRLDDPGVAEATGKRMKDGLLLVEGSAQMRAPSNFGQLRASMTSMVETVGSSVDGAVGSALVTAPYMEYGTGALADGPVPGNGSHWPPSEALDRWAYLHGFGENAGFIVARIIGLRGGLEPRRFLRGAWEEKANDVMKLLSKVLDDVAKKVKGD